MHLNFSNDFLPLGPFEYLVMMYLLDAQNTVDVQKENKNNSEDELDRDNFQSKMPQTNILNSKTFSQ